MFPALATGCCKPSIKHICATLGVSRAYAGSQRPKLDPAQVNLCQLRQASTGEGRRWMEVRMEAGRGRFWLGVVQEVGQAQEGGETGCSSADQIPTPFLFRGILCKLLRFVPMKSWAQI